jgi:hypothetical protein
MNSASSSDKQGHRSPVIHEKMIQDSPITQAATSSSSHQSSGTIPESWSWISEIMGEAHLPTLGLPVRWESTQKRNMRIAFDPSNTTTIDIDTGQSKKLKSSPIGFIDSTKGKNPIPGTETPAAARYTRYLEPCFNQHFITGPQGETLVPCIAHGDYVDVESLQVDHAQAKEDIQQRQQVLVALLNDDPEFARFVMQLDGMNKFFVKVDEIYYGTVFFYDLYFNDIDNLWLICGACNLHKSNEDAVSWFRDQWLYGDEFINYIGRLKDPIILAKTENKQGLAEVAIQWYWDRHANYASISKRLMEDVVTPIQILNQRVDRVVGLVRAGSNERRLQRHMASLDFRIALLSEIAHIKGIDMPRADSESPHSSSDEGNYFHAIDEEGHVIPITLDTYKKSTAEFTDEVGGSIQAGVLAKIKTRIKTQEEQVTRCDNQDEKHDTTKPRLGGL